MISQPGICECPVFLCLCGRGAATGVGVGADALGGEYEKGRRKGKAEGKAEGKEVLQMRLNRAKLGQVGEAYARTYLESKGYQTLAVNYRCPYGEIDLIAREAHELVFIEIKSRTGSAYGSGFESITRYKRQHILRTACHFLAQQRKGQTNHCPIRFDVVEVTFDYDGNPVKAKLIQNAFAFDS